MWRVRENKRNRNSCFCYLEKGESNKPISEEELAASSYSSRLENKTKELEKELSATKETLEVEREEITKFQETSEEWSKRQKQELLDRIKELEAEVERLKKLTPQELINEINELKAQLQQNGRLTDQIEVKKWPWLKIRK